MSDTLYTNEPPDPTLKEYLHLTTDQPGPKIRFCLNHRTHPLPLKSPNSIGSLCIYPPPNLFLLPKLSVYLPLGQACQLGLPLKMEGRIPLKQSFGWTSVVVLWFSTWNFWSHKKEANLGKGQRGGFLQPYHSFAIPSHQFPFSEMEKHS